MKGRKPKPTALRLIEGNREHRTIHQELEPHPHAGAPPKPPILDSDGKKHWKHLCKHLESMNCLAESDQGTILGACLAFEQACSIKREITAILKCAEGIDLKHLTDLRRLLNATVTALVKFEADLGLNPTARTRIKLDKPDTRSRRERLLAPSETKKTG